MHAIIHCSACKQQLRVPETAVGKNVRCPRCGAVFLAQAAPAAPPAVPQVAKPGPAPLQPSPPVPAPPPLPAAAPPASVAAQPLPARRPAAAVAAPFSLEDEEESEPLQRPRRPARSRPPRSVWPWILIGVGAAAGLAVAVVVMVLLVRSGGWREFSSTEGRFRVQMPGTPVHKTQNVPLGGAQLVLHVFAHESAGGQEAYVVMYNDYPAALVQPGAAAAVLTGAQDGAIRGMPGSKLTSARDITLDGYPGRELALEVSGKGKVHYRLYLVNNRLYQVVAQQARPSAETVEKFFNSFQLLGAPAGKGIAKGPDGPEPREKQPPKLTVKEPMKPVDNEKKEGPPPPPKKAPGEIVTFPMPHGNIHSLAFAPDGKTLASTGEDHTIRLWDTATGQERAKLAAGGPMIEFLAFSPDGKWLASRGGNNIVSLRDGPTGKLVAPLDQRDIISTVAFSPDSKTLAVAAGGTVKFWDMATRQEQPPLRDNGFNFLDARYTADGKGLVTAELKGGQERSVKIWDLDTRKERASLKGFGTTWAKRAQSPDGKYVATVDAGGVVKLADVPAGRDLPFLEVPPGGLAWMTFTADSRGLLTWGPDGVVRLWDVASRQPRASFRGAPPGSAVGGVAVAPDGRTLATAGARTITIWDAATVLAQKVDR
jgi:hypothetical protein